MKYVALLRGINVGGNNIIKMVDLKAAFEKIGLKDVATFIQSGNVVFSSSTSNQKLLAEKIEKSLSKRFNYKSKIALISQKQLSHAVKKAPKGFGKNPKYRYNVIFLRPPLKTSALIKEVPINPEVDEAVKGKDVLYFSYPMAKATRSRLSRLVMLPVYKEVTIRNWNTTTKLLRLIEQ